MVMDVVDGGWAEQPCPEFFSPSRWRPACPPWPRRPSWPRPGCPRGDGAGRGAGRGPGPDGPGLGGPPGTSLLLSVVRPPLHREAVWPTVAAAGVALAEAVDAVAPVAGLTALKWPNDLELHGRKAAGLLAEAHLAGDRLAAVLLGMGVNVAQTAADLPPEVADQATSVSLAAGAPVDRAGCWPPGQGGSLAATRPSAPAAPVRCSRLPRAPGHRRPAGPGRPHRRRPGGRHRRRPHPHRRLVVQTASGARSRSWPATSTTCGRLAQSGCSSERPAVAHRP